MEGTREAEAVRVPCGNRRGVNDVDGQNVHPGNSPGRKSGSGQREKLMRHSADAYSNNEVALAPPNYVIDNFGGKGGRVTHDRLPQPPQPLRHPEKSVQ